ncbi:MAG: hypothetical protein R3F04_07965 [Lysobacteraceae bacterium]
MAPAYAAAASKPRRSAVAPDRRGRRTVAISARPPVVDERSIGDWELDTMVKAHGGQALVTLTEGVHCT